MAALTRAGSSLSLEQEPPSAVSPPSPVGAGAAAAVAPSRFPPELYGCFAGVEEERGGRFSGPSPTVGRPSPSSLLLEAEIVAVETPPIFACAVCFVFVRGCVDRLSASSDELESHSLDSLAATRLPPAPAPGVTSSCSSSLLLVEALRFSGAACPPLLCLLLVLLLDADEESDSLDESDPSSESDEDDDEDEEERGDLPLSG
uniref:Uncharacterized protein n=1 Tax=Anopheles atroparvus TaxID=41427 RepID=A0A182IR56_ANOAO